MAKELEYLNWVEELLPRDHIRKRMFGGFSYYVDNKLILLMFESTGNRDYRGVSYPFEIWNGCMFPVEKEKQDLVIKNYPFFVNHPILPKWLYLPADTEDFESQVESVMPELRRKNPLFGTFPKPRGAKMKKQKEKTSKKIDTRRPRMFSDESAEEKLKTAKKLSDLRDKHKASLKKK